MKGSKYSLNKNIILMIVVLLIFIGCIVLGVISKKDYVENLNSPTTSTTTTTATCHDQTCKRCGYNWYELQWNNGNPTEWFNRYCGCCGGTQAQQDACKKICVPSMSLYEKAISEGWSKGDYTVEYDDNKWVFKESKVSTPFTLSGYNKIDGFDVFWVFNGGYTKVVVGTISGNKFKKGFSVNKQGKTSPFGLVNIQILTLVPWFEDSQWYSNTGGIFYGIFNPKIANFLNNYSVGTTIGVRIIAGRFSYNYKYNYIIKKINNSNNFTIQKSSGGKTYTINNWYKGPLTGDSHGSTLTVLSTIKMPPKIFIRIQTSVPWFEDDQWYSNTGGIFYGIFNPKIANFLNNYSVGTTVNVNIIAGSYKYNYIVQKINDSNNFTIQNSKEEINTINNWYKGPLTGKSHGSTLTVLSEPTTSMMPTTTTPRPTTTMMPTTTTFAPTTTMMPTTTTFAPTTTMMPTTTTFAPTTTMMPTTTTTMMPTTTTTMMPTTTTTMMPTTTTTMMPTTTTTMMPTTMMPTTTTPRPTTTTMMPTTTTKLDRRHHRHSHHNFKNEVIRIIKNIKPRHYISYLRDRDPELLHHLLTVNNIKNHLDNIEREYNLNKIDKRRLRRLIRKLQRER